MCIYTITNTIDGKFYIGQTNNLKIRETKHKWLAKNRPNDSPHLYAAINKYGDDKFIMEILTEFESSNKKECRKWANSEEWFYIDFLKTRDRNIGYNIRQGGENYEVSDETKEKLRNKGLKISQEHKEKLRLSNVGRVISEETRKKIGLANSGKPNWSKGKPLSEIHKNNISAGNKGKNKNKPSPNKGKKASIETRKKSSESHKGQSPGNKDKKLFIIDGKRTYK